MLRTIIIDDEPDSVKLLSRELEEHCPGVEIIGRFTRSEEGLKGIQTLEPDLLFLDIEMPRLNGFELLERVGEFAFSLIFVTAYDSFALKAFKFSALDYLLKPIYAPDLISAVSKAQRQHNTDRQQLEILKSHYYHGQSPQRLAIHHQGKVIFLELKDIVYCEADGNYTKLQLVDGKVYLLTKTLRDVQAFLEEKNFMRVHRQFLINLDHIVEYMRGEGNYLVMTNKASVPVARNQKERLLKVFGWL